jgi:hypothetical protein
MSSDVEAQPQLSMKTEEPIEHSSILVILFASIQTGHA